MRRATTPPWRVGRDSNPLPLPVLDNAHPHVLPTRRARPPGTTPGPLFCCRGAALGVTYGGRKMKTTAMDPDGMPRLCRTAQRLTIDLGLHFTVYADKISMR